MVSPVLTLLVASSLQWASGSARTPDLTQLAIEITEAVQAAGTELPAAADEPTVCQIEYYFDDLAPRAAPRVPFLVTYDWRSPVVFDLP